MLFHLYYTAFVLALFPSIPVDLKALASSQFEVREAATDRLESLPGWTFFYFKHYATKAKDAEVRIRCKRVYETLAWKNRHEMEWACLRIHKEKMKMQEREERMQILKRKAIPRNPKK